MVSLAEIVTDDSVPFINLVEASKPTSTRLTPGGTDFLGEAIFAVAVLFFRYSWGMTRSLRNCPKFSKVVVTGAADMEIVYCVSKINNGRKKARIAGGYRWAVLGNAVPGLCPICNSESTPAVELI